MLMRLIYLIILIFLSGCAIGNRMQYDGLLSFQPTLPKDRREIIIGVQDQRPNVLSGKNSESNVGTQRSLAGVPWTIKTQDGRPLAQDLGSSISKTFNSQGYDTKNIIIGLHESDSVVASKLKDFASNSLLFFFGIKEWQQERWFSETFNYCAELKVRNASNQVLAHTSQCGNEKIGGTNPDFQSFNQAVGVVIGRLINASEIKSVFNLSDLESHKQDAYLKPNIKSKNSCSVETKTGNEAVGFK